MIPVAEMPPEVNACELLAALLKFAVDEWLLPKTEVLDMLAVGEILDEIVPALRDPDMVSFRFSRKSR